MDRLLTGECPRRSHFIGNQRLLEDLDDSPVAPSSGSLSGPRVSCLGNSPKATVMRFSCPSRMIVRLTDVPGGVSPTRLMNSCVSTIGLLSMDVMISPGLMPALSAGLPACDSA